MNLLIKIVGGIVLLFVVATVYLWFTGNTDAEFSVDYESAVSFEKALNDGVNPTGEVVSVVVDDFIPDGPLGYTIHAGEHLNFISLEHPDVGVGDTLTVRVNEVSNLFGSYIIHHEPVVPVENPLRFADRIVTLWNFNGWLDEWVDPESQ